MKNKKPYIYLDFAATTPVDPEVLKAMIPYFKEKFGNPSSNHYFGYLAKQAIDSAREKIANFLNCSFQEIIFTGSATESNNLAIKGVVKNRLSKEKVKDKKIHIICSKIEHPSVLEVFKELEKENIKTTYLPVNKEGFVSVSQLEKSIYENTFLISIIYANNEIGTIQPIVKIGNLIERINKKRNKNKKIIFHTDAVQAANYLDCNVKKLKVDLMTLSGHKIYGPKGIGALFIKKELKREISPLLVGGDQEFGLRASTENVPNIVGFGKAIEKIKERKRKIKKIKKLRNKLIKGILKKVAKAKLNGSLKNRLPNNANFLFEGTEAEILVSALDQEGILVSTGSACKEKYFQPSSVLLALGLSKEQALSSLRITLGFQTTEKDIDKIIKVLPRLIGKLKNYQNKLSL